jgi:outer membrane lipoprotein-sorting protein
MLLKRHPSLICTFLLLLGLGVIQQARCDTASDLVAKTKKAYDALQSYSCHVDAKTTSGNGSVSKADADIKFVRPGKFISSGTSMFATPYAFVVNGSTVNVTANGSSSPVKDADSGLAEVTGISGQAATRVGALLLHTQWGDPFPKGIPFSNTVTTQNVNGHPCYMLVSTGAIHVAYWIDKTTYLLAQISDRMEMGNMGTFRMLQTVTASKINPPIPDSAFAGQ